MTCTIRYEGYLRWMNCEVVTQVYLEALLQWLGVQDERILGQRQTPVSVCV